MTRSEMREQVFKELFLIMFYKEDEIDAQCEIYKENLSELEETERNEISEKVKAVIPHIRELDEAIDSVSEGWKVKRMGKVELSILRLAAYEMKYDDQVPVRVAINEAVELTKTYGGDESFAFVNAILGKLAKKWGEQ
ncbi:MAG: transcription antitermination factor NusB [Lachnospiraceae bacterium]|nr:transcription antitermination factor NusB [Lachnospiraceae bacterium]